MNKKELLLQKLIHYWDEHPHLRLGQIVVNAWRTLPQYKQNPEPEISDLFYIDDDKLLTGIENLEELSCESKNKRDTQA